MDTHLHRIANGRGRGGATRGGRGRGGSRGDHVGSLHQLLHICGDWDSAVEPSQPVPIAAPVPTPTQSAPPLPPTTPRIKQIPYTPTTTLCKCTNSQSHCHFSHPSPVARLSGAEY